jgi:tetratricopeptide (TPR) repeat protein
VHGASSLLIPAGPTNEDQLYLAFDYLIDQPDHEPIPPDTWNLLVARTDQPQAVRVASEAFWRVRTAFHAAVDSGAADDVFSRASAMADRDDYLHATQLLTDALNSADNQTDTAEQRRSLRHQIAFYQMLSGRVDQAEASFKELLAEAEQTLPPDDEYLQVVRHNIASCAQRRGNLPDALAQFRRILADRERQLGPDAMNTLATRSAIAGLVAEMGDPAEALRQTQAILDDEERALGTDHTNTLSTRTVWPPTWPGAAIPAQRSTSSKLCCRT